MRTRPAWAVVEQLYAGIEAYRLSHLGRRRRSAKGKALTYGEVLPGPFSALLKEAKPRRGEVFYDLGSGTGKAVLTAAVAFDFARVVGVEVLPELHRVAERVFGRFDEQVRPRLPPRRRYVEVRFIQGDFRTVPISDADVVFIHATCFDPDLIRDVIRKLEETKAGTRVVSVTQALDGPRLRFQKTRVYPMDWGLTPVHYYVVTAP